METEQESLRGPLSDLPNQKLSDMELIALLTNLTGYIYTFANGAHQRWGENGKIKKAGENNPDGFFQLMPHTKDDGFFDWYSDNRSEYQFFKSKNKAVLHFIFYWTKWKNSQKANS